MDPYGSLWLPMAPYGSLWLPMGPCGSPRSPWVPMGLSMGRCGSLWVCVARLGFSEVEQVQMVVDGVKLMVEMEKKLEQNQPIDDMIPAQK